VKLYLYGFFYFFSLQLNGQGVKVIDFKEKYYQNDSVFIALKNIDTINYYVNIQLEKKRNKGWLLYTKDIFSSPFADILSSKVIPINTTVKYTIILPEPEWFEDANWSDSYRKKIRDKIKIGIFRYKIYFSKKNDDDDYNHFLYSPIFLLQPPSVSVNKRGCK